MFKPLILSISRSNTCHIITQNHWYNKILTLTGAVSVKGIKYTFKRLTICMKFDGNSTETESTFNAKSLLFEDPRIECDEPNYSGQILSR